MVLTRRRLENGPFSEGLSDCAYDLTANPILGPRQIRHSTIAAFKGLEADVVVLADVDDLTSPEAVLLNYVAIRGRVASSRWSSRKRAKGRL